MEAGKCGAVEVHVSGHIILLRTARWWWRQRGSWGELNTRCFVEARQRGACDRGLSRATSWHACLHMDGPCVTWMERGRELGSSLVLDNFKALYGSSSSGPSARAGVHTFLPMLHFSAPAIGGGVRGDGGGLDRGCSIEACQRVRNMDWPPAKTRQVLVLLAHGWTLGCAKVWWHMFGG